MLHITAESFAQAMGQDYQTASKRLRPLSFNTGQNGTHWFALARVLPIIRHKEDAALPALFNVATNINIPTPPDAEHMADDLDEWLGQKSKHSTRQGGAVARLAGVRRAFAQHVADSTQSSALCRHTPTLARLLILDDSIMRYVLLNDQTAFPSDFSQWSLRFAIETFNTPAKTAA